MLGKSALSILRGGTKRQSLTQSESTKELQCGSGSGDSEPSTKELYQPSQGELSSFETLSTPKLLEKLIAFHSTVDRDETAKLRSKKRKLSEGGGSPPTLPEWLTAHLTADVPPNTMSNLEETTNHPGCGMGFDGPTEVQRKAVPIALARKPLLVSAPTGSGKTLAFLLPIIATLTSLELPLRDSSDAEKPLTNAGEDDTKLKRVKRSEVVRPPVWENVTPSMTGGDSSEERANLPSGSPTAQINSQAGKGVIIRSLIICPTRELCLQSVRVFDRLISCRHSRAPLRESQRTGDQTNRPEGDDRSQQHRKKGEKTPSRSHPNQCSIFSMRCRFIDSAKALRKAVESSRRATAGGHGNGEADGRAGAMRIDIAVATPLRLLQLCKEGVVNLKTQCTTLVLDEADRLLELGLAQQMDGILSHMDLSRTHVMMFSATLPSNVILLARSLMADPVMVNIGAPFSAPSDVDQQLLFCTHETAKITALRQFISEGRLTPPCLLFVQDKQRAHDLFEELLYDGLRVGVLHSDLTACQRDAAVTQFRAAEIWVLISTDIAARGLDFSGVRLVINYDFPTSASCYIHRIGRTGRAGHRGTAITMFTEADSQYLRVVVGVMRQSGCEVAEWMQHLASRRFVPKKAKHLYSKKHRQALPATKRDLRVLKVKPPSRRPIQGTHKKKLKATKLKGSGDDL
eukprot:GHVN01077100.1.p1 GENE.GHVN01077100.1~~GHVN01077100.1.p1  ORF type:complete len:687 (+),score=76.94 GHVN01077100.1:632-2692(+)